MSDGMLFDVPVVESPRLRWIKAHRIVTRKTDHEVQPGEEDCDGMDVYQWYAWSSQRRYGGPTEDDALAAWARANGARLWNEEGV